MSCIGASGIEARGTSFGSGDRTEIWWLEGAAPAFDEAVVEWLRRQGFEVNPARVRPRPRLVVPLVTRTLRVAAYRRLFQRAAARPLIFLPYLAGDTLLLAGMANTRTIGVALGSDILRRVRTGRVENVFRNALRRLDAVWAVSDAIAEDLTACGRPPTWVAPVGVDLSELRSLAGPSVEEGRIFSARRAASVYRLDWIRRAVSEMPGSALIEASAWPRSRMFEEYLRAEVVVSMSETDGAPATIMEALCVGAHVVASGGATVRGWLERLGGTYGEPKSVHEVRSLIREGLGVARRESATRRQTRAAHAKEAFDRDRVLRPLKHWLESKSG